MNTLEISLNDRIASVTLLEREGNRFRVRVDETEYDATIIMVERGAYLLLMDGKSYNIELIEEGGPKKYIINTYRYSYDAGIIDAETRYQKSRHSDHGDDESAISSPMPGKVVRILVKPGDEVKAGDTVIVVAAMKMESEYKVKNDRLIKEIKVREGDTIDAHQPLVIIE
ncbi:MAG: biotin/lipoyl-binding protein [Bacteroidetes bacterium]|nr:MAG: biotin/lipoyl-binding protein [Bacteroidota bacterium]